MNDVERTVPMRPPGPPGLPRRRRQAHLEPQLREPGGAGTGTPFVPFVSGAVADGRGAGSDRVDGPGEQPVRADGTDAPDPGTPARPHDAPDRRAVAGARAATFRAGARREPQPRG